MKIGIITHSLQTNYGGLLQNYALQQVLKSMGHDVYTLNRNPIGIYSSKWHIYLIWKIKQAVKKIAGIEYMPAYKDFCTIRQHCIRFVKENIQTTPMLVSINNSNALIRNYNFNAYVVGSDQVWRPSYSQNIYNDFLDFCQNERNVKRIAYAASFGVSDWVFNETQTKECSRLAKLFDAISVREDSGISLCENHLGVNATLVLDPTLLLDKENYIELVEKYNEEKSSGNLFCYILDNDSKIQNIICDIEEKHSLQSFQVKAKNNKGVLNRHYNLNDHIIPAPTKWLRAFMDAKMVLTDSFHGCVFSIIFNKPFWAIGNKKRGNARFDSLLKLFNLENRRIDISEINDTDFAIPIDWDKVNSIKKEWQEKSIKFIKDNL